MNDIVVQEFYVRVEGKGLFAVETTRGETMVPMFGYDETGKAASMRYGEEHGYAPPKQEWIDEHIVLVADDFRNSGSAVNHGITDIDPVHIAIVRSSDAPNQIGIVVDSSPMSIGDSSITVESKEYNFG